MLNKEITNHKIILVIAGNYSQYNDWYQFSKRLKRYENCHYISFIEELYGYRGEEAEIVLIGEYWKNPAYKSDRFINYIDTHNFVVITPDLNIIK